MINPEYTLNEIMWFLRVTVTRTCTFLYPDQIFKLLTISKAHQFLQPEILFFYNYHFILNTYTLKTGSPEIKVISKVTSMVELS